MTAISRGSHLRHRLQPHRGFAVALCVFLASGPAWSEERFALVIGANAGWSNDRPLRHAESNAERVRDVLVELGGFAQDRVFLLRDPDTATVRSLLHKLDESLSSAQGDSLLFFYYSGHADSEHLHLRGPALSHQELYSLLRESSGKVRIGVVDACRSGSVVKDPWATPSFQAQLLDELQEDGLALMTSSGADELAQEQRALAGSIFTHHLVSGLRGAADSDDDGQVTLAEAYQHAWLSTRTDTSTPATSQPPLLPHPVVLSQLKRASSTLVLPRAEGERYIVVDRHGWRLFAEARSHLERQVLLALPPGEYKLYRLHQERLERASVVLTVEARVDIGGLSFEPRSSSSELLQGRPERTTPAERRAWLRTEALRLLAAGEARLALRLFDRILKEQPDDLASRRGRGRALVRLAEAYARARDTSREWRALRAALVSDPSLGEDPGFQRQYQQMKQAEAVQHQEVERQAQATTEAQNNPRLDRRWGLTLDVAGPRGLFAISGLLILSRNLAPYLSVDVGTRGFDGGLQWMPDTGNWSWSPFARLGVHMSMKRLGIKGSLSEGLVEHPEWEEVFGFNLHLDTGMQYATQSGFAVELGAALVAFPSRGGGVSFIPMPLFGIQWLF